MLTSSVLSEQKQVELAQAQSTEKKTPPQLALSFTWAQVPSGFLASLAPLTHAFPPLDEELPPLLPLDELDPVLLEDAESLDELSPEPESTSDDAVMPPPLGDDMLAPEPEVLPD